MPEALGWPWRQSGIVSQPLRMRFSVPMSAFIEPCLPSPADKPPSGANWIGNRGGRPHGSRNRAILNEEFIAALLRHFRRQGERAIARMAKTQPAAYCKILTLLVPREHKLEHANAITSLSDEQLEAMIEHIKSSLERRAAGDKAKVIEGTETLGGERPGSPRSRR